MNYDLSFDQMLRSLIIFEEFSFLIQKFTPLVWNKENVAKFLATCLIFPILRTDFETF